MHGGKHEDNVGTLDPNTMCGDQVEDIPRGNAGVKGVRVLETPDPIIFDNLEDEGSAYYFAGSDEQLVFNPGGPFSFQASTNVG